MNGSERAPVGTLLAVPGALVSFALLGLGAVLLLPELAPVLPGGDEPEPNEAQLAVTSLGLLLLSAACIFVVRRAAGLGVAWGVLAFGYNAAIVVVKFVLSPASYRNSPETALSEHLWVGIAVLLLYATALAAIYAVARRHQASRPWAWSSKVGLVLGLLLFAVVSRNVAAMVLGRTTSDYLEHVFTGAGLCCRCWWS